MVFTARSTDRKKRLRSRPTWSAQRLRLRDPDFVEEPLEIARPRDTVGEDRLETHSDLGGDGLIRTMVRSAANTARRTMDRSW